MFLHIGNGENVVSKNIIGIFDLDTASISDSTKKFLKQQEQLGLLSYSGDDLPRSFLLLKVNDKTTVKLSRISTLGLKQRIKAPYGTEEND